MTIVSVTSITSLTNTFAADYDVISIDFVWTAEDGITSCTVYAPGSEPGTATTNVPAFSYINDTDVERVTTLLMAVIDDSDWGVSNIAEIGGSLSIDADDAPVFEGEVTSASPVCIQY